jgi:hypothetical protein
MLFLNCMGKMDADQFCLDKATGKRKKYTTKHTICAKSLPTFY